MLSKITTTDRSRTKNSADNRPRGADRLVLVRQGLDLGKSQRQIACELGVDEGTIRRDIKKLQLPEIARLAVEAGDSAEQYLRAARTDAAQAEIQARMAQEKSNSCHSDALAKVVLDWLDKKDLVVADEERILDSAERVLWTVGDSLATPRRNPQKVLARFERGELPDYMPARIEHYISVLVEALPLIAPEKTIRTEAIRKAVVAVHNPERRPVARRPWGTLLTL